MLVNTFEQVLTLSALGSALILLLFLLRPLTAKHFAPKWQYYIWLLVLNTLVIPLPKPVKEVIYLPETHPLLPMTQAPMQPLTKVMVEKVATVDWMQVIAIVWAAGVLFSLALKLTRYCFFKSTLRENSKADTLAVPLPKGLYVRRTWLLDAPLLIGVFHPTLYLPESVSELDLTHILAHELMHYKRRDLLFKWYAQLVFSVHWFNPLMLLVSRQIDAECEASCDFEVTCHWEEQETTNYMAMILERCSESAKNRLLTTRMASGKRVLKRRFYAIQNGRKVGRKRRWMSVLLALLLFLLTQFLGVALAKEIWQETVVISVSAPNLMEEEKEPVEEPTAELPLPEEHREQEVAFTQSFEISEPVSVPMGKVLNYNSDERTIQTTTVYPDENGYIHIQFDSSEPRAIADLEIRNGNHPGGWGYSLPTDPQETYVFGGFNPDQAYAITLDAYCPGNYGILGSMTIY